ncbi:MAG TPA: AAA family ATPase [Thermoanaerobaculia bacterium]
MIYAFGQYELDTRVFELRAAGQARPVEPQVFDVLVYLVTNRDRVVSKEELLERLWPDRFVTEATLTSRLKAARKAVGDTGKQQTVIRTHHGRGYRFVASVEEQGDLANRNLVSCVSGEYLVPAGTAPAHAEASPVVMHATASEDSQAAFVGREDEIELLAGALNRALSGTRQVVFIQGEAGAGKTTLVDRFLARNAQAPFMIARGQCVEHRGSGEPYMPLLDALGRLCRQAGGAAVIEVLRREAASWLVQLPSLISEEEHGALVSRSAGAGERMLREFCAALERLTADRPLVLSLEDLHWSDHATLDALDLLARRTDPARLLVLGTCRPNDGNGGRHAVHSMAQELRVRGQCELVALPLLGSSELDALLTHRFGDESFTNDVARVLHARTGGNALFAGNLIDSWVARELIVNRGDGWSLAVPLRTLEIDVPDSLQHLIEKQLREIDDEQQRILEAGSVIGRSFPVALVAAVLAGADEDVERDCERLAREGRFIRPDGSEHWGDGTLTSRFAFVHDLYGDVVYETIPAVRRGRTHQQVGRVLERVWQGREKDKASELALHFQRSGDRERAPRYLQLAAEQAFDRSAYREAVVHLSAALEFLLETPESPERGRLELEIRSRLAPALVATRGYADSAAEESYLRASELARQLGDDALLSQTLYGMATMYEFQGQYTRAEEIVKERMRLDDPASRERRGESHELLTCSLLHQGRYREAVAHGERALEALEGQGPFEGEKLVLLVQAHGWLSGALFFAGRADDALMHSRAAVRTADEGGDEFARASAAIQAAFLRYYLRDEEECRRFSELGIAIARERRFPFHVACGRILRGWWLSLAGDHDEAVREIRAGIRTCHSIGARMDMPLFQAILAEPLVRAGAAGALLALDEGLAMIEGGRSFFYHPELLRGRGLLLLEQGEREAAIAEFRTALSIAREQESPTLALRAATSICRATGDDADRLELRAICESLEQGRECVDMREAMALMQSGA